MKSFSKAAENLYLTQPTVTSHIQNLENELGTILINRQCKNLSLTEAGRILYKYAINILNMRDMAQFDLGVHKGKIQGHLKISSSSIPKQYVLPKILKDFTQEYPDVTFTITSNDSRNVIENILEGNTDFGIVGAMYESKHLEYIELLKDDLVVVVPNTEKYIYNSYEMLDKDFLLNEKIIFREKGSGTRLLIEKALKENNVSIDSLNIIAYVGNTETIKKFIEEGIGISIISERAVKKEIELGIFKPYLIKGFDLSRKFYFVYHKTRQLSPLSNAFRDFIINFVNNNSL
jgi:DNA-binding transcriptional LysR family regulator